MLKLTRTKTQHHIVFCADSTRWRFTKHDQSKLQEVLELMYEYQSTGLEPQQVKDALLNLHTANKTIWDIRSKKPRWIPVTERLPDGKALTCDKKGNIHVMWHYSGFQDPFGIAKNDSRFYPVTHWMPMPEPPKGE